MESMNADLRLAAIEVCNNLKMKLKTHSIFPLLNLRGPKSILQNFGKFINIVWKLAYKCAIVSELADMVRLG